MARKQTPSKKGGKASLKVDLPKIEIASLKRDDFEDLDESVGATGPKGIETDEVVRMMDALGSVPKVAEAMGVAVSTVRYHLKKVGYTQQFSVQGLSTLVNESGKVVGQWIKSARQSGQDAVAAIRSAVADMKPVKRIKLAVRTMKEVLVVYTMGDPHVGMYAWLDETGEPFDLEIAERNLTAAMLNLVKRASPSERCLIVNVGDYFHADNSQNTTARSANPLDVDTRWAKVFATGVRIMVRLIETALTKHKFVHIISAEGNHDTHSSIAFREVLISHFRNNPRVIVDPSPSKFHYFEFGETLIGVTHGDTVKFNNLPSLMATDKPKEWGRTRFRYFLVGHYHHTKVLEQGGVTCEILRTLAPKDAWHSAHGYRGGRDMVAIEYTKDGGEYTRHRADIAILDRAV